MTSKVLLTLRFYNKAKESLCELHFFFSYTLEKAHTTHVRYNGNVFKPSEGSMYGKKNGWQN